MLTTTPLPALGKPQAFAVIVWGGLVAGILDAADALVAFGLVGFNPVQVLQFISSGAFGGAAAFGGGLLMAGLGMLFHFIIAFAVAAVFYVASRNFPELVKNYVPAGLLFGAAVYFVMTYLVLPLTALAPSPFSLPLFLNGVIGHAVFVGLPIAWFAHRSARAGTA